MTRITGAVLTLALLAALPVVAGASPAGAATAEGADSAHATTATAPARPADLAIDQAGRAHAWRGEVGTLTVLDFAATWCAPCRRSLPRLQELQDSHPELRVLVVSVDDTPAQRDRLVEDLSLHLPVVWDEGHRIAEHYRPGGMPATVVLDAAGREVYRHTGSGEADWRHLVDVVESRLDAATGSH